MQLFSLAAAQADNESDSVRVLQRCRGLTAAFFSIIAARDKQTGHLGNNSNQPFS